MNYINRLPGLLASGCIGPWVTAVGDGRAGRRVSGVSIPLASSLQCGLGLAASLQQQSQLPLRWPFPHYFLPVPTT